MISDIIVDQISGNLVFHRYHKISIPSKLPSPQIILQFRRLQKIYSEKNSFTMSMPSDILYRKLLEQSSGLA
jgi:hypothetical protein